MNGEWLKPPFEKVMEESEQTVSREPELEEPTREEKAAVVEAVLKASARERKRKSYWDFVE
jgi:hypothetical protein